MYALLLFTLKKYLLIMIIYHGYYNLEQFLTVSQYFLCGFLSYNICLNRLT